MPIATLRSVGLYYESHGPETAPAIVFAHGWGGSHLSWFQQVPAFMDRYRCVTFDHRSWGQSRATDDRAGEAFVDDLLELLDHLEIAPATFVAQSMGGWTCLNLALAAPSRVDRLLMADSPGGLSSETISAVWAGRTGGGATTSSRGCSYRRGSDDGVGTTEPIISLRAARLAKPSS